MVKFIYMSYDNIKLNAFYSYPERLAFEYIVSVLQELAGDYTLFEAGAQNGRLLLRLNEKYPEIKYVGIDLNKCLISRGLDHVRKNRLQNIELFVFDLNKFSFTAESKTIFVSVATLIYLNESECRALMRKLNNLKFEKIILIEPTLNCAENDLSKTDYGFYLHDFARISNDIFDYNCYDISIEHFEYKPWTKLNMVPCLIFVERIH